jgi:hypothetical protein
MLSKTKRPTAAEVVAEHIEAVTKDFSKRELTPKQLKAALILARCFQGAQTFGTSNYASPFDALNGNGNALDHSATGNGVWAIGDLDGGSGGSEFTYAYLPVRLIEQLSEVAEGLPEDIADIYTTAATIYFTNSLRSVLDEAVMNLFYESATVIVEQIESLNRYVDAAREGSVIDDNTARFDKDRFNAMIDRIVVEGNQRRRERLREAMAEVDPKRERAQQISGLYRHYLTTSPAWDLAREIYRANKSRSTWKQGDWQTAIRDEVQRIHSVDLPTDLVALLSSGELSDRMKNEVDHLAKVPQKFLPTPDGFALEHAARLCGLQDFSLGTAHLGDLKRSQEKESPNFPSRIS